MMFEIKSYENICIFDVWQSFEYASDNYEEVHF